MRSFLLGVMLLAPLAMAQALEDQGLENAAALIRLVGVVEHFHPSDQSLAFDWAGWTVDQVDAVEGLDGHEALAAHLDAAIKPMAPSVFVWAGENNDAQSAPEITGAFAAYRHEGMGADRNGSPGGGGVYKSLRIIFGRSGTPPEPWVGELIPGVWAMFPLAVGVESPSNRTQPRPEQRLPAIHAQRAQGWSPTADDRATRIVSAGRLWSAMQHFYPYFEDIEINWPEELRPALAEAALAENAKEQIGVLERLLAKLRDGHGRVWGPGSIQNAYSIPAKLGWVEGHLVVLKTPSLTGLRFGDVILAIDGVSVEEWSEVVLPTICSGSDGWTKYRLAEMFGAGSDPGPVVLSVERLDGKVHEVRVVRQHRNASPVIVLERPFNGQVIAPGVVYFSLVGTTEEDLNDLMPELENAEGIVFDLRGYPDSAGFALLGHLSKEVVHSNWWNVPIFTRPDQVGVEHKRSRWDVPPRQPYLGDKRIVFIIDGSAISYSESCMGVIEAHELGLIIGEATAGSNGNVNHVTLPDGHTATFTGMRVTKHDDSRFHTIGVQPQEKVELTLAAVRAGRDEMLERAIALASGEDGPPTKD